MKKQWTAALLALALAAGLLRGTASAAQADAFVHLGTAYAAQDGADGLAGSRLTGVDREVYRVLKAETAKIANGTRSSTVIRIPNQSALSWTLAELGAEGEGQSGVIAKLKERLAQTLHMDRVYSALSADCPYELYWRDLQYSWDCVQALRGSRASIEDITIRIQVAEAYRGGSETTVDPRKVQAAKEAADNARAIVEQYQGRTDYEKLAAYREEICRLVSYDTTASSNVPYGDPWQLVYVFDGDQTTNVVCEGYAKAFQYLCDLSEFDGDVACYTVSGRMNGGGHMWNVVRMEDGKNYLVDVTNCDEGASGAPDKLFLAGAQGTDGGRTQTVTRLARGAAYTYSDEQEGLFTSGWLELSGADYKYDPAAAQLVGGFTDVRREAYCAEAVAWAVREKITKGTTDTTFSPEDPCTHAEILTFLWRAAGQPEGEGRAPDGAGTEAFYYEAVRWADGLGMADAAGFDPDAPCDRAAAVMYIWAAFGRQEAPASSFGDVPEDAPYAPAVDWAVERGVTLGATETTFAPGDGCSRGNIVTLLYRAYH